MLWWWLMWYKVGWGMVRFRVWVMTGGWTTDLFIWNLDDCIMTDYGSGGDWR